MSDEEVIKAALRDLPTLVPGSTLDLVADTYVERIAFSHPPYQPGSYRKVLDFKKDVDRFPGLSFVSDLFNGAYIESTLCSSLEAVAYQSVWYWKKYDGKGVPIHMTGCAHRGDGHSLTSGSVQAPSSASCMIL